jgi:hypothetical protein
MERISLRKEKDILSVRQAEIINPREYVHCTARLEVIESRLHKLAWEIPRLDAELRSKLGNFTPSTEPPGDDQSTSSIEQNAPVGLSEDVN